MITMFARVAGFVMRRFTLVIVAQWMAVNELLQVFADDDQVSHGTVIRLEITHGSSIATDFVREHGLIARNECAVCVEVHCIPFDNACEIMVRRELDRRWRRSLDMKSYRDHLHPDSCRGEVVKEDELTGVKESERQGECAIRLGLWVLVDIPRQILRDHEEMQFPLVHNLEISKRSASGILDLECQSGLLARSDRSTSRRDLDAVLLVRE